MTGVVLSAELLDAGGPLEPRDPSDPDAGVVAGRVADVPPEGSPQAAVVLHFTGASGRYDVRSRQGGTFTLELPAGAYSIVAADGGGVCPDGVVLHAGTWQRVDVLWPCRAPSHPLDGAPPNPAAVPPPRPPAEPSPRSAAGLPPLSPAEPPPGSSAELPPRPPHVQPSLPPRG